MNVKIDTNGSLIVKRAGKDKPQYCPFIKAMYQDKPWDCGDWCPMFDEVECVGGRRVHLRCSNDKYFAFDLVKDERVKA